MVKIFAFTITDGVDKVGIEVGNWGVEDFVVGVAAEKFVADGLDEVSFTKSWTTV